MRSDGNLKLELCKEQCAPQDLVSKILVEKAITQRIEHSGRVQVRVERGVEIQRREVPVRVPLPQIPHDTLSRFNEAIIPNYNRFELGLGLTGNRQSLFVQLHPSNDRLQLFGELANRPGEQDFFERPCGRCEVTCAFGKVGASIDSIGQGP